MIYVNKNKRENRIMLKIKTGYYLETLTAEAMKLLWRDKSKMTEFENGEIVPNLAITEVRLGYQKDAGFFYAFVPNKSFG